MAIELAASINTVSAYRSDLNHLVGFIEETGTKLNIETLDETLLGNYLTDLNRDNIPAQQLLVVWLPSNRSLRTFSTLG